MIRRLAPFAAAALAACASPALAPLPSVAPPPEPAPAGAPAPQAESGSADEALRLVNAWRARNGRDPLVLHPALNRMAQVHVAANAAEERITHEREGGVAARLARFGFRNVWAGEADVRNQRDLASAVAWWTRSDEHNEVLLLPQAAYMGYAHARSAAGRPYWTVTVSSIPPN